MFLDSMLRGGEKCGQDSEEDPDEARAADRRNRPRVRFSRVALVALVAGLTVGAATGVGALMGCGDDPPAKTTAGPAARPANAAAGVKPSALAAGPVPGASATSPAPPAPAAPATRNAGTIAMTPAADGRATVTLRIELELAGVSGGPRQLVLDVPNALPGGGSITPHVSVVPAGAAAVAAPVQAVPLVRRGPVARPPLVRPAPVSAPAAPLRPSMAATYVEPTRALNPNGAPLID